MFEFEQLANCGVCAHLQTRVRQKPATMANSIVVASPSCIERERERELVLQISLGVVRKWKLCACAIGPRLNSRRRPFAIEPCTFPDMQRPTPFFSNKSHLRPPRS